MKRFLTFAALALFVGACGTSSPSSPSESPSAALTASPAPTLSTEGKTFDSNLSNWSLPSGYTLYKDGSAGKYISLHEGSAEMLTADENSSLSIYAVGDPVISYFAPMKKDGGIGAYPAACTATPVGTTVEQGFDDAEISDTLSFEVTPRTGTLFGLPAFGRSFVRSLYPDNGAERVFEFCVELHGQVLIYERFTSLVSVGGLTGQGSIDYENLRKEDPDAVFDRIFLSPTGFVPAEIANATPTLVSIK